MKIGVLGIGRMGRILAERIAELHTVTLFDADAAAAQAVASSLGLCAVAKLADLAAEAVVLAVPDSAVGECVESLRAAGKTFPVFSVATNISREKLAAFDRQGGPCLNVKIIGHAGEMGRGARPILVADGFRPDLAELACAVFASVGDVIVGDADQVKQINGLATEAALRTGVALEASLRDAGVADARMVQAALALVAPGVLRAYAEGDLGPFARGIVAALRGKAEKE